MRFLWNASAKPYLSASAKCTSGSPYPVESEDNPFGTADFRAETEKCDAGFHRLCRISRFLQRKQLRNGLWGVNRQTALRKNDGFPAGNPQDFHGDFSRQVLKKRRYPRFPRPLLLLRLLTKKEYYYYPVDGGDCFEAAMFRTGINHGAGKRDPGAQRPPRHTGIGMRKTLHGRRIVHPDLHRRIPYGFRPCESPN